MLRLAVPFLCLAIVSLAVSGCRETGTIRVNSIKFEGVNGVDESALKNALATKPSSKFFFGTKRFFNRSQFENDLKRIAAFYSDHGYPHARITNFDVKLNAKQDAVDVKLTVDEGAPVIVQSIDYQGFDAIPEGHLNTVKKQAPIQLQKPRDKAQVLTTREMALN